MKVGRVIAILWIGHTDGNIHVLISVCHVIHCETCWNGDAVRERWISDSTEADRSDLARYAVGVRVFEVQMEGIAKAATTWNTDDVKPIVREWCRTGWNYAIRAGLSGYGYCVLGRGSKGTACQEQTG